MLVPVAAVGWWLARRLSSAVESTTAARPAGRLVRSRSTVSRLASLFALDSFAGGFTVSAFVAYWLRARFDASPAMIAATFFAIGVLQTVSFLAAPRLADRFGLLRTMVFTHLPSNLLLAAVAFAPNLGTAIVLLLARTALSQMDVPTRQTYVMALVDPEERTPAAAYTNTARYVSRPAGPPLAALAQTIALGLPFVISGGLKSVLRPHAVALVPPRAIARSGRRVGVIAAIQRHRDVWPWHERLGERANGPGGGWYARTPALRRSTACPCRVGRLRRGGARCP